MQEYKNSADTFLNNIILKYSKISELELHKYKIELIKKIKIYGDINTSTVDIYSRLLNSDDQYVLKMIKGILLCEKETNTAFKHLEKLQELLNLSEDDLIFQRIQDVIFENYSDKLTSLVRGWNY